MRTTTMVAGATRATGAVNPGYRTSTEITTKAGGIFWGVVLLLVGVLWFAATAGWISVSLDLVLPSLLILGGVYLLITKLLR